MNPALWPDVAREVLPDDVPPGSWDPVQRRFTWGVRLDDALAARVASERDRFDAVAVWRHAQLAPEPAGPWTHSPWLVRGEVDLLLSRHPELAEVAGLTVLDVGGTAPVAWRFLASGAHALHHVDVSPASQAVGLARCALHGVDAGRLVFHTAPAERLPFRDAAFDLVFSRNSAHHLARPAAWDELARVLRPGGRLLVFEPWLNRVARMAVMGRRRALRIDRGTDDPLGRRDLVQLAERFREVEARPFGIGATAAAWALGRVRPLHPALRALHRVEGRWGGAPWLARGLASHAWVLATR